LYFVFIVLCFPRFVVASRLSRRSVL
jgi:hypothetical protein